MKKKKIYRPKDLLEELDRDKTTILRWEKEGIIPKAHRDSRGWRYYTREEFEEILKKAKQTNYFRNRVLSMVCILAVAVLGVSLFMFSSYVFGNANLNANLNVAAGSLAVSASSTVEAFSDASYSFTAQTSTAADAESVGVSDTRGGAGSWTLNLSCQDNTTGCYWLGETGNDRFQMVLGAAASAVPSTSGIFCVDSTNFRCVSAGGDACTFVTTETDYECFPSAKTDITLATGSSANGEYWFAESDWAQAVPGMTSASVYTTTLTYDLQ